MVMVAHQKTPIHEHPGPLTHLRQGGEKDFPVRVVRKDRLPPIASA